MTSLLDPPEVATKAPAHALTTSDDHYVRRMVWRGALVLIGLLVAWLGVGHWRGGVQMRELQRVAAAKQAEFDAQPSTRPALWGETHIDAAWPHYQSAIADVAKLDQSLVARLCRMAAAPLSGKSLNEPPNQHPPVMSASELLAAHAVALAELHAGAHANDSRRPMVWSAGFSHRISSLLTVRAVVNIAVLDAHITALAGGARETVHRVLDAAQLGRDFMQAHTLIEQMIGCAMLAIACHEGIAKVDLWRHLDAAAVAELAEGLARLDASLPLDNRWLASEAVLFANHFAHSTMSTAALFSANEVPFRLSAWRFGCDLTLAAADHGLAHLAASERLAALTIGNHSVDMPGVVRLHDELAATTNPISQFCTPNIVSAVQSRLQSIAQVRLLRMACQHALGTVIEALPDPSGGTLRYAIDAEGTATLWSDAHRKHTEFTMRR